MLFDIVMIPRCSLIHTDKHNG